MTVHLIDESLEEKLNLLAREQNTTADIILQKAIDAYYMHQDINETLSDIKKQNEKELLYLQSIAILTKNYESIKEVNDSINDFMNN